MLHLLSFVLITNKLFSNVIDMPDTTTAIKCRMEFQFIFSNDERLLLDHISETDWLNFIHKKPFYELVTPKHVRFSLWCYPKEDYGTALCHEIEVKDYDNFTKWLNESLIIEINEERFVKTSNADFSLAIKRISENEVLIYNSQNCQKGPYIYRIPFHLYRDEIERIRNLDNAIKKNIQDHVINYRRDNSKDTLKGLSMSLKSSKTFALNQTVEFLIELKNVSDKQIFLINNFAISVSKGKQLKIVIDDNADEIGLKAEPIKLEPNQTIELLKEIKMPLCGAITIELRSFNQPMTNMVMSAYLSGIGTHYDLSHCWWGELKVKESIFVLLGNWQKEMNANDFEVWLSKHFDTRE